MTYIFVTIILLLLTVIGVQAQTRYGLAKLIAKDNYTLARYPSSAMQYYFTVMYTREGRVQSKTIEVSETVYYKFKEGDYLTIKV